MRSTDLEERLAAIEREMRQQDPALVAAFERLGVFESEDEIKRLLLQASAVVIAMAIGTMSPIAWMLGAVGLYAWSRSS